jgi:copper chaperone
MRTSRSFNQGFSMTAFIVDGMTCDGCARAVARAIQAAAPGVHVTVDRAARRIDVDDAAIDTEALRRALDEAGFSLRGPA